MLLHVVLFILFCVIESMIYFVYRICMDRITEREIEMTEFISIEEQLAIEEAHVILPEPAITQYYEI